MRASLGVVFLAGSFSFCVLACTDEGTGNSDPSGDTETLRDTTTDSSSSGDACDSGVTRCHDDMLQQCDSGAWVDKTDCAEQGQICVFKGGRAQCQSDDGPGDSGTQESQDTGGLQDTGSQTEDPVVDTLDSESITQSQSGSDSAGTEDSGDSVTDTHDDSAQTNVDTGSFEDTDTDTSSALSCECSINSGYPCQCDTLGGACDDGSTCVLLNKEADEGVCLKGCAGPGDDATCAVDMDCFARGRCVLSMNAGEQSYCGYRCELDGDCPSPLVCDKSIGIGLCAPDVVGLIAQGPCDECPLGQWPCPCDASLENPCADGSVCATGEEFAAYGSCLKTCEKSSDCFVDMKCGTEQNGEHVFTGQQLCGVTFSSDPGGLYCGWFCEDDYDCPPNEKCVLINPDAQLKLCFGDADKIDSRGAGR